MRKSKRKRLSPEKLDTLFPDVQIVSNDYANTIIINTVASIVDAQRVAVDIVDILANTTLVAGLQVGRSLRGRYLSADGKTSMPEASFVAEINTVQEDTLKRVSWKAVERTRNPEDRREAIVGNTDIVELLSS